MDWDREKWRGSVASKFIRGGEKNAVKYADEIIVLSKDVQKYFLETYGRETHFIPNGVNRPEVREAKLITDHFGLEKDSYILFLGRLVPEKGIRYLVERSRRKTSMEQELKNLKGEKMRMYEEYAAGTLSLDNYKNKKQEYDRKIAEVQDKIEQSKAEEAAQSVVPGTVRAAAEQAENFLHGTRLTASMVSAFIENVYVHEGGRIVVQFKYEQSIQDAVRALHTD